VLEAKAAAALDFSKLKAGEFYEFTRSNIIIFAQGINRKDNRLQNVFLQQNQGNKTQVISAKQAYFAPATWASASALVFSEGFAYVLDRRGKKDMIIKFGTLRLVRDDDDDDDDSTKIGYKRKAEPTKNLARSDQPKDIAEFQWRLSTPLATMLLGLLGVPLSRSAPGQGRYARLFIAVIVYAIYFNLAGMAKTLVEQGQVGALPGVWWAHALPIVLLLILLLRPMQRIRWWRR
jgi:lipopolysaccharide export system permease protein